MNELVKEKITVENGSIKIEKIISMDMVRVINAVNYRDETLYTTNSDFFKNVYKTLKTNIEKQIYHTFECFPIIEKFKTNVCQFLKIDDFYKEFQFNEFALIDVFFDEVITLFDKEDKRVIKDQIYIPKNDLIDIKDRLKNILPPQCIRELDSKIQILNIIKSNADSLDLLDAINHILTRDRRIEETFTYIFKDNSGFYKIGKSKKVEERLKSLQTGNPTISIIASYKGDFENELHRIYSRQKVKGEWFCLSKQDLDNIRKMIKQRRKETK